MVTTIADEGSFTAAARRMQRVQGAINYHVASLEEQLDIQIFDRSGRRPRLTEAGKAVVAQARRVLEQIDELRQHARELSRGLEPLVSLAVDVLFPSERLARLAVDFREAFPGVQLRLRSGILEEIPEAVMGGECALGLTGVGQLSPSLSRSASLEVELVTVVAPDHPLASSRGEGAPEFSRYVHLLLSSRAPDSTPDVFGVEEGGKWRVNDLHTRLELLRVGLGWSRMPRERIAADLAAGRLVEIRPLDARGRAPRVQLQVIHRFDSPLGPAARWLLDRLAEGREAFRE